MRVGFVLRSAEIKPLFYDLFIESNIIFRLFGDTCICVNMHHVYLLYIYMLARVLFGIERRDLPPIREAPLFYLPPK